MAKPALSPAGSLPLEDYCRVHGLTIEQARDLITPDRIISWYHKTFILPLPDVDPLP